MVQAPVPVPWNPSMKTRFPCPEHENYAQAQREFLYERDRIFSAVESHPEVRPWHLTKLAGFTNADRALWRAFYRIAMLCAIVLLPAVFLWVINMGAGVVTTISAIVTGMTIGAFLGKRIWFPVMVRSEHDRFPQGREFEHRCVSVSESAALTSLSVSVHDWQHAQATWVPDASNVGVSLFTAIVFSTSLIFFVGEVLMGLIVVVVRFSGVCC